MTLLALPGPAAAAPPDGPALPLPQLVDRLTWGATPAELARARQLGAQAYIDAQLNPDPDAAMPDDIQRRIDALLISRQSARDALVQIHQAQLALRQVPESPDKAAARRNIKALTKKRVADTAQRATWRALYSPNQLQEQMTWFWMNHFNVNAGKGQVGTVIDDYEERVIRPRALGKFRDLLAAAVRAPAMILYLDNQHNRVRHINENYARELMELHTLGVDAGYSQKDVQELARILTGLRVAYNQNIKIKPALRQQVVRDGLFLFHPVHHDYGDKLLLGQPIQGRGLPEIDQAVDLLARHPATARHISLKLAQYFVADQPPDTLVDAMAKVFRSSDGDIAATLRAMFSSDAFAASLRAGKFKDPAHYVYSALRLAYGGLPPVTRADVVNGWLARMGQPLYRRATPDGYPLTGSDWSGSGQMTVRFDLARQIAAKPLSFYRAAKSKQPSNLPALPRLVQAAGQEGFFNDLSPATRQVIDQAKSVQDANIYLLASPEFMHR